MTVVTRGSAQDALANQMHSKASAGRWLALACAWGALLITFVDRLAWGNLAVTVGQSLGLQIGALGVFVTAFYVGYVVANVGGGIATDLFGPRKALTLSLLLLGICTCLFGHVSSVPAGLALQAMMGLAAGCDYSACIKLTAGWFDIRSRGRAIGLLMTATSLAVVLTNALIPRLLGMQSWHRIYEGMGITTVLFGLCCFALVRDGPLSSQAHRLRLPLGSLFRNRDLLLLAVAGFGAMWGTWGFTFWANSLMIKGHGLSVLEAGGITMMFGVGAIFSKPLIGLLSDWLGGKRKPLVMMCLLGFAVLLLAFGFLHDAAQFRFIAPFLGVTAFAYSPLLAVMVAEAAGPALAGSATGLTNAFWQLGSVAVPLVVGAVFQSTHSFPAAFMTLAIEPAFAVAVLLAVREA
ncbi:MAG TPA: MFS transporter [Noviherbaspirillum sp.]